MNRKLILSGFLAMLAAPAAADDITLQSSVRLSADRSDVKLRDIAELRGADAQALAEVVVLARRDPGQQAVLSIQDIRDSLGLAGAHWGRINLNGGSVIVHSGRDAKVGPVTAMTALSLAAAPAEIPVDREIAQSADELINAPTLGGMVARFVTTRLQVDPKQIRLAVDSREAALWNATPNQARFELEPLGSASSDRIEFIVRRWGAGGVESRQTLSVRPTVLTTTAAAGADIERGATISERDIQLTSLWLPPSQDSVLAGPADVIGKVAGKRLRAGDAIRKQHVRSALIIERGDRAIVRCLVGGVVIAMQAEAMADGGRGDAIEFRKLGERQTFVAAITGPGEAVVNLSKTQITATHE